MKVDFWQLSSDPVEKVVALIAARVLGQDERLLIVAKDADQRKQLSRGLWQAGPDSFLANGEAGADESKRQPILLSAENDPKNGAENAASHVIYADGEWRGADGFDRAFLLFDDSNVEAARATWRSLDGGEDMERSFFRQEAGKWVKVA
ncbi:MAG: DNA polymerase III subunit chi [Erythrobacter sp.]